MLDRLIGAREGQGLRSARWRPRSADASWSTSCSAPSPSVARRGCRLIIGLEGARIRTEVEAALTFAELEAAGARDKGEDPGWAWLSTATP